MFYLLLNDRTDKSIVQNLYQEIDDLLQGREVDYDSTKKMKFSEAWYVQLTDLGNLDYEENIKLNS